MCVEYGTIRALNKTPYSSYIALSDIPETDLKMDLDGEQIHGEVRQFFKVKLNSSPLYQQPASEMLEADEKDGGADLGFLQQFMLWLISASSELLSTNIWSTIRANYPYQNEQSAASNFQLDLNDLVHSKRLPPQWLRFFHRYRRDLRQPARARSRLTYEYHTAVAASGILKSSTKSPTEFQGGLSKTLPVRALDLIVASVFQELLIRCLPTSRDVAENGYFRIVQNNTFTVECDRGKTRPLHTFTTWTCDPSSFARTGLTAASLCTDMKMPQTIQMTRYASLSGLTDSACGSQADLTAVSEEWKSFIEDNKLSPFQESDLSFNIKPEVFGGRCNGSFKFIQDLNITVFWISVRVKFIIECNHDKNDLHEESLYITVGQKLDDTVTSFMTHLQTKQMINNYSVDETVLKFEARNCADEGSIVQKDERFFTTEVPPCRMCDRGFSLHKRQGRCRRCPSGFYSGQGSTECKRCPLVIFKQSVIADSLRDCYSVHECTDCDLDYVGQGLVVIVIYHVLCLIVIIWNLRFALPKSRESIATTRSIFSKSKDKSSS